MAGGYNLISTATVNVRALTGAAKRFDRNQKKVIGELKAYGARNPNVEFRVLLAGGLDAMNNFRKRYTRYAKNGVKNETQQRVLFLKGATTPWYTGDTNRSTDYVLDYGGSQSFDVLIRQESSNNGFAYPGPVHDNMWNTRTGDKFWFQRASNAWRDDIQSVINPSKARLESLTR